MSDAKGTLENATNGFFHQYKDLAGPRGICYRWRLWNWRRMVAAFAAQGAKVGFVSLSEEPAQQLCEKLNGLPVMRFTIIL